MRSMVEPKDPSRIIAGFVKVVGNLAAMAWFTFLGVSLQYAYTRPTSEQPSLGRLYPLNIHGHVAYLTHHEILNLYILGGTGAALVLIAIAVALVAKKGART
jgi:hypothetical protein